MEMTLSKSTEAEKTGGRVPWLRPALAKTLSVLVLMGSFTATAEGSTAQLSVRGSRSFNRAAVMRVINKNLHQVQECYSNSLRAEPRLAGRITVEWSLKNSGLVRQVKVLSDTIGSGRLAQCVIARTKSWRFPRPPEDEVKVIFPFVFQSESGVTLTLDDTQAGSEHSRLRAQLRGNENRQPAFDLRFYNGIHFLLTATKGGVRVFQEWCSWGYYSRWFKAQRADDRSVNYTLKRKERGWDKNFPAFHAIGKGDFLITDINLCDGTWKVTPMLPKKTLNLDLVGIYEVKPDDGSKENKVWTGKLVTDPIETIVNPACVDVLNGKK